MLDLKKSKFLSKEKLSEIAPSIFTVKPSNTVSDKYIHIPTENVIDDMELLGWDRIFDWMGILEGAEEIHTVDTSLTLILTKLNVKIDSLNITLSKLTDKKEIDVILNPFKEKLQSFEKKVDDNYEKGQKERSGFYNIRQR